MDDALSWVPGPLEGLFAWLLSPEVLAALGVTSVVLFVASVAAVPWFILRVPADHFARPWQRGRFMLRLPPWQRGVLLVLKNLLGLVLLVAGLAMLILPGQGLITLIAALVLLDLPRKHAIERRLVGWPLVLRAMNRLRRRAGRAPLLPPPRRP